MTLGTKILIGVIAGIALGVFLGERVGVFDVVGRIYVGLLQMTVLPYVVVSLIGKIGALTVPEAKRLGGRAGLVLLALWGIALVTVVVMPLSLPEWEAGTFFSSTLVEVPRDFDFLGLYLPTNPFQSLAENVVPATVLFSILVGIALIQVPNKRTVLEFLDVSSQSLGHLSNFVGRMSPYGTFALATAAAGTLSPPELTRLAGYVVTYTVATLLLTFVVLPGFAAAVTPFSVRRILARFRQAGLTAFATGKLFPVLPMVISSVRDLLMGEGMDEHAAEATADVYVPLAYPFPNAGKILSILFLPFAAWFVGRPLGLSDYPTLLSIGLLSFFGSPVAAIPFLLDLLKLPLDLFPLFLVAGIWCARIGDVLGAMHLLCFTAIASAWNHDWARLNPLRLGKWAACSMVATLLALLMNHWLVSEALAGQEPSATVVEQMDFLHAFTEVRADVQPGPNGEPLREGEDRLARIRRTKVLRAGYVPDNPPFAYRNGSGKLVGLDIDLLQLLAGELGAELQPVPCPEAEIGSAFTRDWFDIASGSIPSSIESVGGYRESPPYLELHLAFLVPDHMARQFRTRESILAIRNLSVAYVADSYFVRTHRYANAKIVRLESFDAFVLPDEPPADALLVSAEAGSVLSMLHPKFSVVVPAGTRVRSPIVFALPPDAAELERLVGTWVRLKTDDGTKENLYDHWILGQHARKSAARWSILHDVLGWAD
jgi:Na+/H+-dicarboxylate symporter/ABC-type amino acid transport substrate-binding protein